jgi:hypothetical protein
MPYTKENWTPGQWKAERGNVGDQHPLFVVSPTTAFRPPRDADAHLIAAAPDLYTALTAALEEVCGENAKTCIYGWHAQARAALAKARGDTDA